MRCLINQRLSMTAELWHWQGIEVGGADDVSQGNWTTYQDPITGEIRNEWVPTPTSDTTDAPSNVETIPVLARGVISQGVYASGSGEKWGASYDNFEVVRLWIPPNIEVSKRDRVTNIKDARGSLVFKDEENSNIPTVYNVQGVTPILDGFNRLVQQYILLEKAPA